jgi:hypothetical protein
MENFSASDRPPWDQIKREIDQADCCVTILGGRYGSVDETGVSYTEKEYTYSVEQKKPVLTFLRKDIENLPASKIERDPDLRRKLESFRTMCKRKQVSFWETESDLKAVVTRSLAKFIQENLGHVLGRSSASNIREEVRVLADNHTVLLYARKLSIPHPGMQTLLSWSEFGFGIELLMQQIRSAESRFEVDAVIGINEAGLSIAAFLCGGLMHRCPMGFIRIDRSKLIRDEWLPSINSGKSVLLVDVEIKSGSTLSASLQIIRRQLRPRKVFFACLGAQVNSSEIGEEIGLNELESFEVIRKSRLAGFFVALIGPRPSLEPPLYLD